MDVSTEEPPREAVREVPRRRGPESLKTHTAVLVALFVASAAVLGLYQRAAARGDARRLAFGEAVSGATIAARDVSAAVQLARSSVATTAANPALQAVFAAPSGCTLNFGGVGSFRGGHLDIVGPDGTVYCSSMPASRAPQRPAAPWLAQALSAPTLVGPVEDARTGKQVIVIASPIVGKGAVVAFLDLDQLGPALAETFGGPRHLEFVVVTADERVVLARSIEPARWAGAVVSPSALPMGSRRSATDLSGTRRLYGQVTTQPEGWKVFAGASESAALADATRLSNRELLITLAGLLLFLVVALSLHRRVARPVRRLRDGVRTATIERSSEPIRSSGPAEIASLTDDFNGLITTAHTALRESALLAAIVESSDDAIISKTLDGVITSWNRGAEQMYGYQAAGILGHNFAEIIPPDRADELAAILSEIRLHHRVQHFETQRLRKDGTVADVSVTVSPIRDERGGLVGASTVARDITERLQAEKERLALKDRLRQSERLESLGQLAGGIAHDFNNLLSAIMNYAAFVADETTDRPEVAADVQQIQAAAERAARLTRQLLIFGRREPLRPEAVDLNAIVADVHNLLSRSIGEQIELVVAAGADIPTITSDRGQLEQILLNLAVNARDAMPEGGALTIETSFTVLDEGYVRLHPEISAGDYVELAVSDTGTGISKDVVDHIFEPFFTTKPTGEGTGLGLATVYGIIREAGGSISVYSEAGIGTTFRLYFPASDASAPATTPEVAPDVRGQGQTILVVEDEPAVLELTSRILRQSGYVVLEASTLDGAIRLATDNDFHLLLTDSVMPEISGRTLADRINQLRPGKAVLYMSGYSAGVAGRQRILDPDVTLIQKPFNRRTLLEAVHGTLARHQGESGQH